MQATQISPCASVWEIKMLKNSCVQQSCTISHYTVLQMGVFPGWKKSIWESLKAARAHLLLASAEAK